MIGFTEENHTVSEGVGMFTDITVGLIEGELGQEVVITVSTQTDMAKSKFILCTLQQYYHHSIVTFTKFHNIINNYYRWRGF